MNNMEKFEMKLSIEKSKEGKRGVHFRKEILKPDIEEKYLRKTNPKLPQLSEFDVVRHFTRLSKLNFSIDTNFYPLGSCTMKYNPKINEDTSNLEGFTSIHPEALEECAQGTLEAIYDAKKRLCEICGMDDATLWPVAGAHSEFTGILIAKKHFEVKNELRDEIIVPDSAHGTNPATATMAGFKTINMKSNEKGEIDLDTLKNTLNPKTAVLMLTIPNTLGVFESQIEEIVKLCHNNGTLVYMDGANMNAQVGLTAPGLIGADVCHLNLHKTFAIPHGGGGPGMGPICVKSHLAPFLPGHVNENTSGAVSAAPFGSASILLISYAYIRMLGATGVKAATEYAILNANYMRARLTGAYDILYTNASGQCAHEFIVDLRPFKKSAEIEAEDVAKRLMDYGFHAPTMSFPVAGTIMIEPTESEDKAELDRFCDALLQIREEIRAIEEGKADKKDNPLKNAPHTQEALVSAEWNHAYSREEAVFPLEYVKVQKFWPSVARVNNTHGDRNLVCTCEPVSAYA